MSLQQDNKAIAIVGMSCRLPQSNNVEEFWNLLEHGVDATSFPPDHRWLQRDYPTPINGTFRNTNAGFLTDKVDKFDAGFFGISPKEAVFMDPQQRLLHQLVWEGLEDAGIDPTLLKGTNGGVFSGSWTNDYKDILLRCGYEEFYRRYMGNSIGAAAAKISFLLGMTGPSIATESGCSSGMVAVHMACKSLQKGETDMALACGVNLLLKPFNQDELPVMVSPKGRCRPFDSMADGFGRAEGGGVLVLKRLSDAIEDGSRIWAIIRGSAIAQEGLSMSMGTPTVHSESLAMKMALKDAEIHPSQVSYVEAHGTGTPVGDNTEILAISKAYKTDKRPKPLLIGSVKGNVGHTESSSGITGIIRVVLSMNHEKITKQINFTELNPSINLAGIPAQIPLENIEWNRGKIKRIAGVSSFGITGTDAHLILQEAPLKVVEQEMKACATERPLHLLKVTAKSVEALNILLDRYKDFAGTTNETLSDMAFATNTGRANFKYRAAIIAESKEEIADKIEQKMFLHGECKPSVQHSKICFLFTGQGSQYPGMAKKLYDSSPVFMKNFDKCDNLLKEKYQINIKETIWGNNSHEISCTIYSQTSIFCVEYALLKLWESWGVKPDYVLGHSLGEYAAAVCAEILTVEDALTLIAERSLLIDQLPRGKMLVIKAGKKEVELAMEKFSEVHAGARLDYAAINSNNQTVVAGNIKEIMEFSKWCATNDLKNIVLEATHAFHSRHMDPILGEYRKVAETIKPRRGKTGQSECRYISGLLGKLMNGNDGSCFNAEYCVQHTRNPVLFLEASQTAVREGCSIFVEIGPQPILSALTMMNSDKPLICLASLKRNEDDWRTLLNSLGTLYVKGMSIDWNGFEKPYSRRRVQLPHYPFIGKRYWPDVMPVDGTAIHPLLGQPVPNPLSTKLYKSKVNLGAFPYLKDHVVGQNVIFPGAGYLEMCLAAGAVCFASSSDTSKLARPLSVINLSIKVPLALEESSTSEMHTVVDIGDQHGNWHEATVKIFHTLDSKNWVNHAEAKLKTMTTDVDNEIQKIIHSSIGSLSELDGERVSVQEVYNQLASIGLNFGSSFLSLDTVWKKDDSQQIKYVFKLKTLNDEDKRQSYLVHPVILDAMIQATMFASVFDDKTPQNINRKKIPLPVKIGNFSLLPVDMEGKGNLIHILSIKNKNDVIERTAVLTDSIGKVKCLMSHVEFVETTIKSFDAVLRQGTTSDPDLWEETYKLKADLSRYNIDLDRTVSKNFYSEEFLSELIQKNENPPKSTLESYDLLRQLSYLNVLKALIKCGWKSEMGNVFKTTDLLKHLEIVEEYSKYFDFILRVLEEEGIILNIKDDNWKLRRALLSSEEITEILKSPVFTVDLVQNFRPALLFMQIGEQLSDILQGKKSPLDILFPTKESENDECPSATIFYEDYAKLSGSGDVTKKVFQERMTNLKDVIGDQHLILRILEVGAGTGCSTQILLEVLENLGIEYEYTYTDISSSFFPAAEKKFKKYSKRIKYMKFNIEEDPVVQGFYPEYYDYICGCEVVHATRDLEETLRNLRMILKPYGKLDIFETTKENRYITFLWGLTSGYWRFQDHHLRKNVCTIDIDSWTRVLTSTGFKLEQSFPTLMENHSFICSCRDATMPKTATGEIKRTWVVFHTNHAPISGYLINKLIAVGRSIVIIAMETPDESLGHVYASDNVTVIHSGSNNEIMSQLSNLEGMIYCLALEKARRSQEEILKPLFIFMQNFLSRDDRQLSFRKPKLIVLTQGNMPLDVGNDDMSHFESSTVLGFCKSLASEVIDLSCCCIDLDEHCNKLTMDGVFQELFDNEKDLQVAFRGTKSFVPKLRVFKPPSLDQEDLKIPIDTDRFKLILPETRLISDLKFGPLEQTDLGCNEIEIEVKTTALNFRDLLAVLKPTEYFKELNVVGFDFAGKVTKVGSKVTKWKPEDFVCGLRFDGSALPSHIKIHEDHVIGVPTNVTLCEAATLPAVLATAYYCLIEVAELKPSDYVLLHTASGGVGLAAIDICKNIGAKIIATAGSKVKRRYLKSLGIEHVFHSRNTSYLSDIMKATNGHGVDVVLNSLTSEGFKEATLASCAEGARFVEMSKINVWNVEEVKALRPDVHYTVVDISSASGSLLTHLLAKVYEYFVEKRIAKPLPYVRFNAVNIRQALQFLQKAKHIGKVICVMPEFKQEMGKLKISTPMFNDRSSYLITGGLGGIGLLVSEWMVKKGAKHIVLAGRSPPRPEVSNKIAEINRTWNANLSSVQLDVGNLDDCKRLLKDKLVGMEMPPLRGVMHAAGTLADCLIVNQTWDKLSLPFNAKVEGTLNLHEVTKDLNLEFFVMFSSAVSAFGTPGQCNHAAANQFEDTFTHYRRSVGLPATTINWGPWLEVGVATEVEFPGIRSISNLEGLSALEFALKSHRAQTIVLNVESFPLFNKFLPQIGPYIDEVYWKQSIQTKTTTVKPDHFWAVYDSKTNSEEKEELLKSHVTNTIKSVLKMNDSNDIGGDENFQKLGVDSLMFMEISNGLQALFGDRVVVSLNLLKEGTTINLVSKNLLKLIESLKISND